MALSVGSWIVGDHFHKVVWGDLHATVVDHFRFRLAIFSGSVAPNAVLAPADGRVIVVEKMYDPYAQRDALKISIFMNVFNVHSNRIAVNGRIKSIEYFPGKFFNADFDKASLENERNAMVIDASGNDITLVQVAGLIARRILCYVRVGDLVKKGERYGFIRFGSRVDVYLPLHAEPLVSVGDKVRATSTLLAVISHLDS